MQHLIQEIFPYYRDVRHRIHANPELQYEEVKTAALVANELTKIGLTPQTHLGKTGVVAVLDSGRPGKTVALRAEMDALPIIEETQLSYQSQCKGKMHACGHDGHTATLLATAHVLYSQRADFSGKIKFIFQPAEEGGAGAKAMIEDGVLENPKVDAIFAYHNHPGAPLGQLLTKTGCALYGNTLFSIKIKGKGGHAAQPDRVINPIIVGAEIILATQALMKDLSNEVEPSVISVTQYDGGFATNIIPETAMLSGSIRASSKAKSGLVQELLKQKIDVVTKQYQATAQVTFSERYPPTINTHLETEFVLNQARFCLGEKNVAIKPNPARATEDFSYYLQKIPGCYFFIGNGEESACCHHSQYDFNDELIKVGSTILSQIAIEYLSHRGSNLNK